MPRKRGPVRRPSADYTKVYKTTKTKRRDDPLLSGTTKVGDNPIRFRASSVKSIDLTDSNGKVIGISYPSKPDDKKKVLRWASRATRTSDTRYLPDYTKGAHHDPARLQKSPWARDRRRPFYVHAHAGPQTFTVTVRTVNDAGVPVKQKVRIDGLNHGRLVASNGYFQRASRGASRRPIVYMSCRSADPGGTGASGSAGFLHDSGTTATIYAPTGTGVRIMDQTTSYYGVKPPPDGGEGTFRPFPSR